MKVVNRVKKYDEFQKIINEGSLVRNDSFNAYYLKVATPLSRFGISIPKKSGNAVIRNRMKRQIRAAISASCDMTIPYEIVFIARKGYDINNYQKTLADVVDVIKKVG